ncbi:MAG: hypothetical protein LBK66_14550 [Spirochaetaceae bacterium]|jgi:hypothetical protein|nr:hypothetical protein [Spirochaetaceae bacterium]
MCKKMMTAVAVMAAALAALTGCASRPAEPSAYYAGQQGGESPMRSQTEQASIDAKKTAAAQRILDWANRGLGEDASPAWLLPAVRGNFRIFKQDWDVGGGKVLKVGASRAQALNAAQTIADVQYAARLANQLKQVVVAKAAATLGSDDQFAVVNDAATKTKVTIAGQERLADFWQLTETTESSGRTTRAYNYYVVYACDPDVWSKLVAKYLYDVTDKVSDRQAKQTIAAMFNEIDAETRAETEMSEAEFAAEIRAQQQALQNPVPPSAQRAAYRSGDPLKIAAASVTPDDMDYLAALAAIAGLNQ